MTLHRVTTRALLSSLPPGRRNALDVLSDLFYSHRGEFLSHERIFWVLWGDPEDGGPDHWRNVIHVFLAKLRKRGLNIRAWTNGTVALDPPARPARPEARRRADISAMTAHRRKAALRLREQGKLYRHIGAELGISGDRARYLVWQARSTRWHTR